jgi:hypothetical protein
MVLSVFCGVAFAVWRQRPVWWLLSLGNSGLGKRRESPTPA